MAMMLINNIKQHTHDYTVATGYVNIKEHFITIIVARDG